MDCKKALQEANGDLEAAVDILRKKGQKVAEKRAARKANEGLVVAALSDNGKRGALLELNCETDFVARNEEFGQLAEAIARIVLEKAPQDTDALQGVEFAGGRTVEQTLMEATGKIGEKIVARRFALLESEGRADRCLYSPGLPPRCPCGHVRQRSSGRCRNRRGHAGGRHEPRRHHPGGHPRECQGERT